MQEAAWGFRIPSCRGHVEDPTPQHQQACPPSTPRATLWPDTLTYLDEALQWAAGIADASLPVFAAGPARHGLKLGGAVPALALLDAPPAAPCRKPGSVGPAGHTQLPGLRLPPCRARPRGSEPWDAAERREEGTRLWGVGTRGTGPGAQGGRDWALGLRWVREEGSSSLGHSGPGDEAVLAAARHSPEPSRLLYKVPLIFRQRTGSSLSYTEGSQLYLVPPFSWTEAKGAGGDGGPGRRKQRSGTSQAQQAPPQKGSPRPSKPAQRCLTWGERGSGTLEPGRVHDAAVCVHHDERGLLCAQTVTQLQRRPARLEGAPLASGTLPPTGLPPPGRRPDGPL